jgi:hypothetical protein
MRYGGLIGVAMMGLLAATGKPAPASWRHDPVWDDGRAEFCVYEVTWSRYGHLYPGRAVLVTVKEPWAPDLDVKADRPRAGGFDVLKLNHARDVPTGIYTYHQMASVYVRRDDGSLRKLSATSSELCGISTADMTGGTLRTRSYFDGQADRTQPWQQGVLPEDGLPIALRDYIRARPPATLSIFPSLLMGRFGQLAPRTMRVDRAAPKPLTVPAGTFRAIEIRVYDDDLSLAYAFEVAPPHRLVHFRSSDGTEYRLAKGERLPYWEQHDPGGEAWLPAHLR